MRLAIGVDLGATKTETALIKEDGTILQKNRFLTPIDPIEAKEALIHSISPLLSHSPQGIGIGVAAQVEAPSGLIRFAPNLFWRSLNLIDPLQQALALPVRILNDVRAATIGEWRFGRGQGETDFICLFVGTGVGGSAICSSHLIHGYSNAAGEFGHIPLVLNGRSCRCGLRGCLEAYIGGWALAKQGKEKSARTVIEKAHLGNACAQKILDEAYEMLEMGLTVLIHSFNPSLVILGGGIIEGLPEWPSRLEKKLPEKVLKASQDKLLVTPSALGSNAILLGASSLFF